MPIHFGTDGWRAVISDTFTFDNLRIVAQAIADSVASDHWDKSGNGGVPGFPPASQRRAAKIGLVSRMCQVRERLGIPSRQRGSARYDASRRRALHGEAGAAGNLGGDSETRVSSDSSQPTDTGPGFARKPCCHHPKLG